MTYISPNSTPNFYNSKTILFKNKIHIKKLLKNQYHKIKNNPQIHKTNSFNLNFIILNY